MPLTLVNFVLCKLYLNKTDKNKEKQGNKRILLTFSCPFWNPPVPACALHEVWGILFWVVFFFFQLLFQLLIFLAKTANSLKGGSYWKLTYARLVLLGENSSHWRSWRWVRISYFPTPSQPCYIDGKPQAKCCHICKRLLKNSLLTSKHKAAYKGCSISPMQCKLSTLWSALTTTSHERFIWDSGQHSRNKILSTQVAFS